MSTPFLLLEAGTFCPSDTSLWAPNFWQRTGFYSSSNSFLPSIGRFSSLGRLLGSSGLPSPYQTQSTLKDKCLREVTEGHPGCSWNLPAQGISLFPCQSLGLRQDHPEPQDTSCSLGNWGDSGRTTFIPENRNWSRSSGRSPCESVIHFLYSVAISIKDLAGSGSRRGRS